MTDDARHLKIYVGKIDGEVRRQLEERGSGRRTVTVMPLMKRLTFDIISSLLFGLERTWAVPVNLPFTAYSRSLRASARARRLLTGITREIKAKLQCGEASRSSDLMACLLSLTDDHGHPRRWQLHIVHAHMTLSCILASFPSSSNH
ncbi:hypothetical protein PR202_ga29803 [Eleusine coracana subsp. coracana]|uniref:Uncharacterized protein n=1 Tax=Eleusine coracana subsp. coracana TaxID=191504 RepID=A0AAV5DMQ3_ELECO|nr:hypothetical protein PR202_ga29803 [Eleusine coracana subsp. coracana]